MPGTAPLSREDIAGGLRDCGARRGDLLVVHSSLKSVGQVAGGAAAVVAALQEIVGSDGTLMMPTFSFNLQLWEMGPFDRGRTPGRVGALAEAFRLQPGVLRSLHPTHSVAAWGRHAPDLVAPRPWLHEPLGIDSPFDKARLLGAKVLLIGVGQTRNSMIHLAEHLSAMPYLDIPFTPGADFDSAWYVEETGAPPRLLRIRQMPGSSEGFGVMEKLLEGRGLVKRGRLGNAQTQLMDAAKLCEAVCEYLERHPDILLRHDTGSAITRRRLDALYKIHPGLRPHPLAG